MPFIGKSRLGGLRNRHLPVCPKQLKLQTHKRKGGRIHRLAAKSPAASLHDAAGMSESINDHGYP